MFRSNYEGIVIVGEGIRMTAKRFTIQGQSIKHNDELLTLNMVCEMLNDYAEENNQLKQTISELKKEIKELSCGEADWLIDEMI